MRRTDIDRQIRAIELKNEAFDITGGQLHITESDAMDPAVAEQFWENVVAYESAPITTLVDRLEAIGVSLPATETLSEEALTLKLWQIAEALAGLGVCLEDTDHLSDRELYSHLYSDLLREKIPVLPRSTGWSFHTSPIGSGSEEAMQIYHRYYASDKERRSWQREFPDYIMPAKKARPYNRDRRLRQLFEDR